MILRTTTLADQLSRHSCDGSTKPSEQLPRKKPSSAQPARETWQAAGHFPTGEIMKVLELRICASKQTSDESLLDVARVIKEELGATGIDVVSVTFQVTSGNESLATLVM